MDSFMEALKLMGIGVATVFAVLIFIIYVGNLLITLVNKFAVAEEKTVKNASSATAVDANVALAIDLAINKLTDGKKKADKIERV